MSERRITKGLKITFLIHAIIAGVFGLQHLLLPRIWTDLAGVEISETVTWRALGAALIGMAVASWLAYRESSWRSVRIFVVLEIVWSALGALVIAWGIFFEGLPPLEWLNFAILTAFAIIFGYFHWRMSTTVPGVARGES